jgi:hypothetical protein
VNPIQSLVGCILGQSALGCCYLVPDFDPTLAPVTGRAPEVLDNIWSKALEARGRIMLQPTAVSNYATGRR